MATHTNRDAADQARANAARAQDKTKGVMEKGKQQAKEVAGQAQDQAKSAAARQKEQAKAQLDDVAQAFRQTGDQLRQKDQGAVADYTDKVADQVERVTQYLDEREVDHILADAEDLARRQPEIFLGSAFALGLAAARFIKSSSARRRADQGGYSGQDESSRSFRTDDDLTRYRRASRPHLEEQVAGSSAPARPIGETYEGP